MKKGDGALLPDSARAVLVCLGWTCYGSIDFDSSVVPLDNQKRENNIVYFGNTTAGGITHRGDNTTGDGEGDDEIIRIDLDQVPTKNVELYVTVNIFSSGYTFSSVTDAYVRLCVANADGQFSPGHELARYKLDSSIQTRGLIFCKLVRSDERKWSLVALGEGCGGHRADSSETLNAIKRISGIIGKPQGTKQGKPQGKKQQCDCAIL